MQEMNAPRGFEEPIDNVQSDAPKLALADCHDYFCIGSHDTVWEFPDGIPFDLPRD